MANIKSRAQRIIAGITGIWSEIEYAQQRTLEIRGGFYEPRRTRTVDAKAGRRSNDDGVAQGLQC
jgi:hypothetical protein